MPRVSKTPPPSPLHAQAQAHAHAQARMATARMMASSSVVDRPSHIAIIMRRARRFLRPVLGAGAVVVVIFGASLALRDAGNSDRTSGWRSALGDIGRRHGPAGRPHHHRRAGKHARARPAPGAGHHDRRADPRLFGRRSPCAAAVAGLGRGRGGRAAAAGYAGGEPDRAGALRRLAGSRPLPPDRPQRRDHGRAGCRPRRAGAFASARRRTRRARSGDRTL